MQRVEALFHREYCNHPKRHRGSVATEVVKEVALGVGGSYEDACWEAQARVGHEDESALGQYQLAIEVVQRVYHVEEWAEEEERTLETNMNECWGRQVAWRLAEHGDEWIVFADLKS